MLRPVANTSKPASAKATATPRPTPRLAPVTNAVSIRTRSALQLRVWRFHRTRRPRHQIDRVQFEFLSLRPNAEIAHLANCGHETSLPRADRAVVAGHGLLQLPPGLGIMLPDRLQAIVELRCDFADFQGILGELDLVPPVRDAAENRNQRHRRGNQDQFLERLLEKGG